MFKINFSEVDRLMRAMENYAGSTEEAINDVLHNQAGDLAQAEIIRLMPRSKKKKGTHAKDVQSLQNITGNLSVTVTTKKKFGYLYFPDDGTNTRRHIGNQQFFARGGEAVQDDIVERCIQRLVGDFEKEV